MISNHNEETEKNELFPTLNNMGYTPKLPDIIQTSFINYAAQCALPALDIGAAFGVATLPALKMGTKIIANDLDQRHLDIIREQTPPTLRTNLDTRVGGIPSGLTLQKESVSAILVARVLHFLSPEAIQESLIKMKNWLMPNGKLFIVVTTPFIKILESYIPIYEQRKANNDPWPGLINNATTYLTEDVKMPSFANLFDEDLLHRVLREANFDIESLFYFPAECPAEWLYDGREFLGCVARNKSSS